jgi:hypothetical protein
MQMTCVLAALLTCLWIALPPATGAEPPPDPLDSALKNLPPVWPEQSREQGGYKVDPYLRAAVALQDMGRERAVEHLRAWAAKGADERPIVLCRMLFTARTGGEFRRPALGAALFVGGGMLEARGSEYKNWPLEPIELVDGVPLLVTRGYALGGRAERPSSYLAYCVEHCDWSTFRFRAKSPAKKAAALKKLLMLEKVKRSLDRADVDFLEAQLK